MFRKRGWFVVPSYDYTGSENDKAPMMLGERGDLVLPDLDICKDGLRMWVEVKYKATAPLYRKVGKKQHGINARHFSHYLSVQKESGNLVYLLIVEGDTGKILAASLNKLVKRARHYHDRKMGASGMVFFDRDEFEEMDWSRA